MDDLVSKLNVNCDDSECLSADGHADHPRFSNFKNEGKVAEKQRQRREEQMQRLNKAREEWLDRGRNIEESTKLNAFSMNRRRANYKNFLMHSDWLVDIPGTLSDDWTLVPSPVGRRCLVVAHKGTTSIYYRNGQFAINFTTALPGGNPATQNSWTILDCICSSRTLSQVAKYYVLDLLWWNKTMYTDNEFTLRQFFLRSKIEEIAAEEKEDRFVLLPSCPCSPDAVTKFMQNDFPYELDGLLFYNNSAYYISEQTPLVGWLKPWMLPEILGIPVPERYMENMQYNTKEYIERYNKKYKHLSTAQLKNKQTVVADKSMDDGGGGCSSQADKAMIVVDTEDQQQMIVGDGD